MDSEKINELMEVYQQLYFTHDLPVPFKGGLQLYPVLVKDYYNFYSMVDILKIEKNEDETGIGIAMTNLQYLIYKSKEDTDEGRIITRKIINLLELVFRIKNGIRCKECDENNDTFISYDDFIEDYTEKSNQIDKDNPIVDPNDELQQQKNLMDKSLLFYNLRKCPKCGKDREDIIRYEEVDNVTKLFIGDIEITDDDFNLLRQLIQYQNMPDYKDEIIDPELKRELELKAKLENPNNVQPSLEKQESCIISATSYTYETIKELSIRHLVLLLRTVDARLHYFCYRQAEASGMVTFKSELQHWVYGTDKKSQLDNLQSLDSLKDKLGNTTKM